MSTMTTSLSGFARAAIVRGGDDIVYTSALTAIQAANRPMDV